MQADLTTLTAKKRCDCVYVYCPAGVKICWRYMSVILAAKWLQRK